MIDNFMEMALREAKNAYDINEVPVGCVIVRDKTVIATGKNMRECTNNSLAHAEIIAINNACNFLSNWRLDDCDMYVTLEPCIMCTGAIINSRIRNVYIGAFDKTCVFSGRLFSELLSSSKLCPNVFYGIMQNECQILLTDFFKKIRKK